QVGVGRTLAGEKIVELVLGEVGGTNGVERLGVKITKLRRQLQVLRRYPRVFALWNTRLKEVGVVGTHLVIIEDHVGQPTVIPLHTRLAFRLRKRQPIAIKIEPIVVGPAAGKGFLMLAMVAILVRNPPPM